MNPRALVVSIHDVSPATRDAVTLILAALSRIGVRRTSLLVVPDYHHRGNINADPAFKQWLRARVAAGHEPVLHGFHHQREPGPRETLPTRIITSVYTAGEGEFFDLPYNPARALLTRGREDLAECAGIPPTGFIAPAWLLSPGSEEAARRLGFTYTTRLHSLIDLSSRRAHRTQSLCWSTRSPARRATSLLWNSLLFRSLSRNPLLRLSIHPPDFSFTAIWGQIQRMAAAAAETREPMTYQEFIASNF